ncbi:MAG: DUF5330 domain-containing protein [Rhizobiales bacterium]|nr:DUF5330 domain-containing protein [Hyphomicrobiales bacterium]
MRIVRTIMLLSAIVILMPSPPESAKKDVGLVVANDVSAPEIFVAATRAASDIGGFCAREPQVCTTAAYVMEMLEAKAKYSVRLIYDWANEASSGDAAAPVRADGVDHLVTSSTKVAADEPMSQTTLKIEDRIPAWRAPTKGLNVNS